MKETILLTGATGFLGSHVAEALVNNSFKLLALKRPTSNCWRCEDFRSGIEWIDIDDLGQWKESVLSHHPSTIIHAAWIGVDSGKRENLNVQVQNLVFLSELLELSKIARVRKFIGFGSQAEYGILNSVAREEDLPKPVSQYGSTKVASQILTTSFCDQNKIDWFWLRLFSFVGERENPNWLIPSIIEKLNRSENIEMTMGEQKYAYMYVKDFAQILIDFIEKPVLSGIYNISGSLPLSLRYLVEILKKKIPSDSLVNFGALPYRESQSMHIEGDMTKLKKQIEIYESTDISKALDNVIASINKMKK